MIGSNTRDYRRDTGHKLYRRSMYTFWKRGAPPASMDILNAPSREFCTVRRERTNTPLQALVTLNDPQFIEAARHLAQVALKEGGSTAESRLDFLARRLLARPLRAEDCATKPNEPEAQARECKARPPHRADFLSRAVLTAEERSVRSRQRCSCARRSEFATATPASPFQETRVGGQFACPLFGLLSCYRVVMEQEVGRGFAGEVLAQ